MRAPQQCFNFSHQNLGAERFGNVFIDTQIIGKQLVNFFALGGQHQDRRRAALGPDLAGEVVTVELRHHDVQDQQVVDACLGIIFSSLAVIGDLDGEAFFFKQGF